MEKNKERKNRRGLDSNVPRTKAVFIVDVAGGEITACDTESWEGCECPDEGVSGLYIPVGKRSDREGKDLGPGAGRVGEGKGGREKVEIA